jgi:hypothetical protein
VAWTAGLVLTYAAFSFAGWQRTLLPDEIRPLLLARGSLSDLLNLARADIVQTPASYVLARLWLNLFGHTDTAAKALPLVLGVASLITFAFLARRATRYWMPATLLFTAVYLRVGSSANLVRMYGLAILLSVIALLLWDTWRRRGGWSWLAAWILAITFAIYTHPSALMLLGAMVVATWVLGPRRLTFTAAAVVPILALLPWLSFVYPSYRDRGLEENIAALADDPVREIARLPFYFLTGDPPGALAPLEEYYNRGTPALWRWSALALFAALGIAAIPGLRQRNWTAPARTAEEEWLIMAALLTILPIVALFAVSILTMPVLSARYLLVTLPAFAILLTGLAMAGGKPSQVIGGLALIWILISAVHSLRLNRVPSPARISADFISRNLQPGDLIVAGRHVPIGWPLYWEWTRRLQRSEPLHVLPSNQPRWLRDILPAEELDQLPLASAKRVWFVNLGTPLRVEVAQQLMARGFAPAETGVQDMQFVALHVKQEGRVQ